MGRADGTRSGPFPSKSLVYPKTTQKPPFQTREEIERKIARGGLKKVEEAELWDALFLTLTEFGKLLHYVESTSRHPFIYPMFNFAAHTARGGARSSAPGSTISTSIRSASPSVRRSASRAGRPSAASRCHFSSPRSCVRG